LLITAAWHQPASAEDYLSAGEIGGISAATVGVLALGEYARHSDSTRSELLNGPLPFEASIQEWLAGDYSPHRSNFIDRRFGGAITPVVCGVTLIAIDQSWPQRDKGKGTFQDAFLYATGLLANIGINSIVKGLSSRPRPYILISPDNPPDRYRDNFAFNHSSFYSGHTSAAFFSATYLNRRTRAVMRAEMSSEDYRNWRWAPPLILYGWSTYVAWSRVRIYRHYISDVAIGALAGFLIAELFYSFNDHVVDSDGSADSPMMLRISIQL